MTDRFGGGDIADDLRLAFLIAGHAVDADINDGCAGLDPLTLYHFRPSDRCDDDVSTVDDRSDIFRAAVRYRHSAAFGKEQRRHRLADDIGTPHHHRFESA